MKKMNINIDRPEVSSEEISAKRDFNSLLKQYKQIEKTPFYVRYRLPLLSAGVLVGIGALLFTMREKEVAADPKMNSKLLSAQTIPIREADVFTEENAQYHQEKKSELPTQKAKMDHLVVIDPKPIASIDVVKKDTVAPENTTSTSLPKQEVKARMTKEEATKKFGALKKEVSALNIQRRRLELQKPVKPTLASGKTFTIDFIQKEFPSLSKYKNIQFEATKDATDYKPEYCKVQWEDGKITQDKDGNYFVSVKKDKESHTFKAVPVFKGEAYTEAVKQYEEYLKNIEALSLQQSEKEAEMNELSKLIK
jgi:predicted RNase H-like HicB family nuclease